MKINEIIKKLNEGIDIKDCGIEVKQYVNIATKQWIVEGNVEEEDAQGMIGFCIKDEDGVSYVDHIMSELIFVVNIVLHYTNIEFDDEVKEDATFYDLVCSNGIYDYVTEQIPENELLLLMTLAEKTLREKVQRNNSFQAIANNLLQELIKKVPSERKLKNMLKKLEGFDFKKLDKIKDLYDFSKNK